MSKDKADGGQAFPYGNHMDGGESGMTLRDWFAGQFLAIALNSCPFVAPRDSWQGGRLSSGSPAYERQVDAWRGKLAKEAYRYADAMVAERSR